MAPSGRSPYIRPVVRIGRYEIERELGRGAMGVVYLATDPRVKRRVAIKTWHLPEGLRAGQREEFRERFLREAQAAGALNHPAIVTVYDADDDPATGTPFIAMEYVEGRSLAEILSAEGMLDPATAFDQAATVAGALEQAHAAGIVHRDIKPANLLVPAGAASVKVADFGVARMASSELTQTGISLGSPAYMSPEQVQGRPADGRSDLFSLAVVLYESLCGERPFKGDGLTALAYAVVHEAPVPISRRRAGLPKGIDAFFDRALAKKPEGRFLDAAAFREAVGELLEGRCTEATRTLVVCEPVATVADPGAGSAGADVTASPVAWAAAGATVRGTDPSRRPVHASAPAAAGATARSPEPSSEQMRAGAPISSDATPASEHAAAAAGHIGALIGRGAMAGLGGLRSAVAWAGRALIRVSRTPDAPRSLLVKWGAGASLLAIVVVGIWMLATRGVTVTVEGTNGFEEASLEIFVDGASVWSRSLTAEKKQAGFMGKKLFEYGSREFGGRFSVSPGDHEIVVEVLPEGEDEPYRARVGARLDARTSRVLEIKTGKGLGKPLSIDLD